MKTWKKSRREKRRKRTLTEHQIQKRREKDKRRRNRRTKGLEEYKELIKSQKENPFSLFGIFKW